MLKYLTYLCRNPRAKYVGFFPPIQDLYAGLFLVTYPNDEDIALNEAFDFSTFITQFTIGLWIVLLSFIMIISFAKSLIMSTNGRARLFDVVVFIWTSFIANFGGKPNACQTIDSKNSYKIVVFTSLFCGSMIWMFYRAQMNAVLSIRYKTLPFTDLDNIADTDWK